MPRSLDGLLGSSSARAEACPELASGARGTSLTKWVPTGAFFGLLGIVGAFSVFVYVVRRTRRIPPAEAAVPTTVPMAAQEAGPVVTAIPVQEAGPVVSVAGPGAAGTTEQTLAECVEVIKQQLKLSGNMTEVLQQAAEQMGINPAGKPLKVLADMCMQQLVGCCV